MHPNALHIFTIKNTVDADCSFRQGVPLPKGEFSANTSVCVVDQDNVPIACSTKVLGLWPDKSVRWLLIEGTATLNSQSPTKLFLQHTVYKKLSVKPQWVQNNLNDITLTLQHTSLTLSKTEFLSISTEHLLSSINWHLELPEQTWQLEHINTDYEVVYDTNQQPLFCDIKQSATFKVGAENATKSLNAHANLRVFYQSGAIELQLTLHNPQPQMHHGGKWDLGNENSLYISDLALQFGLKQAQKTSAALQLVSQLTELEAVAQAFSELCVVQHSSGGTFWNSANHKSHDNKVHLHKRGASVMFDTKADQATTLNRPEPLILASSKASREQSIASQRVIIKPEYFWQKFPTSLHANNEHISVHYIDTQFTQLTELQPGEKLSQRVFCVLQETHSIDSEHPNILLAQINIELPEPLLQQADVLPWCNLNFKQDPLQKLIDKGISGKHNFFNKREALDEFGWRNFGDIYADHEAANHTSSMPFVSHYNNQYDPLYGFLKQWLLSGEQKWKVLADDLFDHLVHIDIYHTDFDKPEYNNGLFWHTDHYLAAETASHRTYSKHQPSNAYQDHAGGGGPGAHHCYTSGLVLYYWLSGNKQAFECMLKLANWISHIYEGDRTLLGLFLRIKNANHLHMPIMGGLLLGSGTGIVRNVFTNRYPLDRGTGNYVNAILDAYELNQDLSYLTKAELIILKTISSKDNFESRNFDDIENTWYYVVFLQSVAKYLFFVDQGKHGLSAARKHTALIKKAFVHYIDYICESEQPYLNQQEKLEYPNDTWTAQDLRKVQLLIIGSLFVDDYKKDKYLKKARGMNRWVITQLEKSDEREYTRLLTLMMQNYGAMQLVNTELTQADLADANSPIKYTDESRQSRFIRFIKQYSVKREKKHLTQRLPKLQKWLGRP